MKVLKKQIKKLINNRFFREAKKTLVIGGLERKRVPITAFNLSCIHRDVHSVSDSEIYTPCVRQAHIDSGSQLRFHLHEQVIPGAYYFYVDNAIIYGKTVWEPGEGMPLEFYPEMKVQSLDTQFSVRDYLKIRLNAKKSNLQNVNYGMMLTHAYSNNYFHFIMDGLLKLVLVFALPQSATKNLKYVISSHESLREWQKDYLGILGIDLEKCVFVDRKPVRVQKLLAVSPRRFQFYYSIDAVRKFRDLVINKLGCSNSEPDKLVYISRTNSNNRHIENEQEFVEELSHLGFRAYVLEEMSVAEQVELFSRARVIVAPHGAGLTNMIYCKQPRVIELFGSDNYFQGFFMTLCLGLGGEYAAIVGDKVYPNGNFEIDVPRVISRLKSYM